MRSYYEELWKRLPQELNPPDLLARRGLLQKHLHPGLRMLDLGCGSGYFTAMAAELGAKPVGVEIAQAAIERARQEYPNIEFKLTPPEGPLPLADASFDLVWVSEVIEHVGDSATWLSEVRRVMRSGGTLIITTPYHGRLKNLLIAAFGFERHYDPLGEHLRFYTKQSLSTLLTEFGFTDIQLSTFGGLPLIKRTLVAEAKRAGLGNEAK